MRKHTVFILLLCLSTVLCMDTYYMMNYCNSEIDMVLEGIDTGRLSLDTSNFVGDCNVTIETWYTADRVMFYLEDLSITKKGMTCDESFVEVYDGQPPYAEQLHNIPRLCGTNKPPTDYVPKGRFVTFRYVNKNPNAIAKMDLIFTAFHRGYCYSYEYSCNNGRCIDDSVNCNGYNPCGDDSDCELSDAAIIGIVVGAVFGVCVLLTIVCVVYRQKRRMTTVVSVQAASPYEVTPARLLHSVPPPSYGITAPYTPTQVYGISGSTQNDGKMN